jgi:hypothetical protein
VEADKADGPDVAVTGNTITVTAGDKAIMRVTADFGSGEETVDLAYMDIFGGRARYALGDINLNYFDDDGNPTWELREGINGFIIPLTENYPDLEDWSTTTTWGTATGTPTVTALAHTAAQVQTAIQSHAAANALVTVALADGNDGTGSVTDFGPASLTGGAD